MPKRLVDPDDLVGAAEIGQRLHVESISVHSWLRRYADFPRPIAKLRAGNVWAWSDVEAWAKATGRK